MELAILYEVIRVPTHVYKSWKTVAEQLPLSTADNRKEVQQIIWRLLKKWFRQTYPAKKLCAFEEISELQARKLKIEQGFYLKIRPMSADELLLSMQHFDTPEDPQFILELNDIPELQLLYMPVHTLE